jgi:bifunctional DNase/RNase
MRLVDLLGLQLEASSGAPLMVLREHDAPHRVLPIFVGGPEAASIAMALSGVAAPRPLTHDVMASLVESLDATVDAVEVTDVRDGSFEAAITLTGPGGARRLDTRPSDAIALAVRVGAPVFVSDDVLDRAGAVVVEPDEDDDSVEPNEDLDADAIDDVVAEFREELRAMVPGDLERELGLGDAGAGSDDASDDR